MSLSFIRRKKLLGSNGFRISLCRLITTPCRHCQPLARPISGIPMAAPLEDHEKRWARSYVTHATPLWARSFDKIIEDSQEKISDIDKVYQAEEEMYDDSYYKHLVESRHIVLGKTVLQSCLINHLINTYPNLDALQIADLSSYLSREVLPMSKTYKMSEDNTIFQRRAIMYADIGEIFANKGQSASYMHIKSLHSLKFSESDISVYCKLAHPRATLSAIMQARGISFEVKKAGKKAVTVLIDNEIAAEESASTVEKAQYQACLNLLLSKYFDEIKSISVKPVKKVFRNTFKDKFVGHRVVELTKNEEGHYGLFLKGGEKVTVETEKFWRYNYIDPIYISEISKGSAADQSGLLQEGDVILAVGDFSLKGMTLESAMRLINKEDNVSLTVKYDAKIKIKENINNDFREREGKAFKDTLKADGWRKWHEAKAKEQPERYLKVK